MKKIGRLKIGKLRIVFVFRHRFEKDLDALEKSVEWREYRLGLWYKKNKVVGKKNSNKVSEWKNNLVNQYMIGINLIICKAWFTVSKGGLNLETKQK